jgi:hypothetical protein
VTSHTATIIFSGLDRVRTTLDSNILELGNRSVLILKDGATFTQNTET